MRGAARLSEHCGGPAENAKALCLTSASSPESDHAAEPPRQRPPFSRACGPVPQADAPALIEVSPSRASPLGVAPIGGTLVRVNGSSHPAMAGSRAGSPAIARGHRVSPCAAWSSPFKGRNCPAWRSCVHGSMTTPSRPSGVLRAYAMASRIRAPPWGGRRWLLRPPPSSPR